MKSLVTLIICLAAILRADLKDELYLHYQNGEYKEACSKGMQEFYKNRKDTEFVSLYAFSCLKADYIDRLAVPISVLRYSPESRANAAYLSVILMQKKLLYHALVDGYDLSQFRMPPTDYVLSIVFDLFSRQPASLPQKSYTFNDLNEPRKSYRLYLTDSDRVKKMVIEEYYDKILTHRHIYW